MHSLQVLAGEPGTQHLTEDPSTCGNTNQSSSLDFELVIQNPRRWVEHGELWLSREQLYRQDREGEGRKTSCLTVLLPEMSAWWLGGEFSKGQSFTSSKI